MTSQTRPSAAIYIAYWSLKDPLFQSQSLPVVRALAAAGHPMAVITFEQDRWRLTEEQRQRLPVEFAAQGITWVPLTYHKQPRGLATVFDIVQGVLACLRLAWRTPVRVIHGRGTVPNAMAWIASRFTRARFFNDADGPLSEEYADARIWSRRSLSYRLTRFVERRCLCSADEVAVLSDLRRQEVAPLSRRQVTVLPCAVDTQSFFPQLAARVAIRQELGLKGLVFVYAGKSGGWYETEWMWDFLKAAQETIQACSVLVLTPEDGLTFHRQAEARAMSCVVRSARPAEMPDLLSAADVGLSFRMEAPSQRACSPIKIGEYLACGLSVVTSPVAGDYPQWIAEDRVGVVVPGRSPDDLHRAARALAELSSEDDLAQRCRRAAQQRVGLSQVVLPRYHAVYRRLANPC